jgi:hypothetical protein
MTKQEFLSGMCFTIGAPTYKGASTYLSLMRVCICKQSRSSIDCRVVLDDYECNILKIGSKSFTGFTYVLNKRVNVKYKFEDLIPFKEVVGE